MKRKKTLLILVAILVVAIVAIFIEKSVKQHLDTVNTIDEEVFTVSEEDLTQITIEYEDQKVTINQVDGSWTNSEDENFPIDQEYVTTLISYFESVHASFIIEDVSDYGQYGLDNPEATLTFTTADGDKTITFGTFSTIDEKRYISVDGGNVYLIDEDILEYVSSDIDDYLDRDSINSYSQVTAITVSGDGDANVVYDPDGDYTYTDTYDFYYKDGESYKPVSESSVTSYISTLSSMDLTEYVSYSASESVLEEYGLNNPSLTITVTGEVPTDDEDEESVESQTQTIYVSYKEGDDVGYLYFDGSSIVYAITSDTYDSLSDISYATLRPSEVVSIDWTTVKSMVVRVDGESYNVAVSYDEDDGNTYTVDDEKVDFVTVTTSIDGLSLSEVGSDYDATTEELSFDITLDDEDSTVIRVSLYQYDGDNCVVDVDGETVGLCSRSSMSNLREEITSAILNKGKEATEEDTEESEETYDLEWEY